MKITRHFAFILCLFALTNGEALSHGENKPGPNGGVIRMPGAYHTELVAHGDHLMVYLLDISFKNPVTKDSSVKLKVADKVVNCEPKKDFFECWATGLDLNKIKKLELESKRLGVSGKNAQYPWPLSLKDAGMSTDHSKH